MRQDAMLRARNAGQLFLRGQDGNRVMVIDGVRLPHQLCQRK